MKIKIFLLSLVISGAVMAQQSPIQFFRSNDFRGINVFETTKADTIPFGGVKVKIGGHFAQDWQNLNHWNSADVVKTPIKYDNLGNISRTANINANKLVSLNPGFNLAMANLNIDVQLADGIRLNLTSYLASRHHQETWVKGGYIQFDKFTFLKSNFVDNAMKYFTIKVGQFDVDYGDQHYRRTDGGNVIYNPFVENYIMDEFATEIGAELYFHHKSGIFALLGVTNGQLNPSVTKTSVIDSVTKKPNNVPPAYHGKIGYDKQFGNDFRTRLTVSTYILQSGLSNTLFGGDRTGSHYFMVMENDKATTKDDAFSGRYNPGFSDEISTIMINPFIQLYGLELFGTYEIAQGRKVNEKSLRKATQMAVDLIYRFHVLKQNLWIGGRYNTVTAKNSFTPIIGQPDPSDITIDRLVGSIGWFMTDNIMMKLEYVNQIYKDFTYTNAAGSISKKDIRSVGKFDGIMIEAAIGF